MPRVGELSSGSVPSPQRAQICLREGPGVGDCVPGAEGSAIIHGSPVSQRPRACPGSSDRAEEGGEGLAGKPPLPLGHRSEGSQGGGLGGGSGHQGPGRRASGKWVEVSGRGHEEWGFGSAFGWCWNSGAFWGIPGLISTVSSPRGPQDTGLSVAAGVSLVLHLARDPPGCSLGLCHLSLSLSGALSCTLPPTLPPAFSVSSLAPTRRPSVSPLWHEGPHVYWLCHRALSLLEGPLLSTSLEGCGGQCPVDRAAQGCPGQGAFGQSSCGGPEVHPGEPGVVILQSTEPSGFP